MNPQPTGVIMAGGLGQRMHPFTKAMPKALLPIGNTFMVDVLVSQMHQASCKEVVISLGHLGPLIRSYCSTNRSLRLPVRFVEEFSPLGTAGALSLLDPYPSCALVVNCDILSNVRFSDVLDEHNKCRADISILAVSHKYKLPYGELQVDAESNLQAWRERPEQEYLISGGGYVVGPKAMSLIKRDERLDMPGLVSRVLASGGRVHAYQHRDSWFDLGTIESYDRGVAAFVASPGEYGFHSA